MRDGPEEIATILNLLLPVDMETGNDFINKYLYQNKDYSLAVKPEMIDTLKEKMKGRVSYLAAMQSDVKKNHVGYSQYGNLSKFVIDIDHMSEFQSEAYNSTESTSDTTQVFELASRQASLFTFPSTTNKNKGIYGTSGFDSYISKTLIRSSSRITNYSYKLKPEFEKVLRGETNEETLDNINKFSSKYAKTISQILNAKDKCIFVYCESVHGSGAILFSLLLRLVGFTKAIGNEHTEGMRYSLLTDVTTTKNEISRIKNRFNRSDNVFGKYIQVIIGSTVVTEGFSLYHIQEEHILTPHWNYTPISQALARGLRVGSHDDLIRAGVTPVVNIYQHVSIPYKKQTSIDLRMYKMAEIKDISIKKIDRLIKESSVDCALTYTRNNASSTVDFSRECEYMKCKYKCDDVDMKLIENGISDSDLDYSTYQLYYSQDEIDDIVKSLELLYHTKFTLHLTDITKHLDKYRSYNILSSLRHIINKNIPIRNKYGFSNYLKEENDIYFLIDNISDVNTYLSSYYTEFPNLSSGITFDELVTELYNSNIPNVIKMICNVDNNTFKRLITKLPIDIQEYYIESVILARQRRKEDNKQLQEYVYEYFNSYIHERKDSIISSFLYENNGNLRCLVNGKWEDCSEDIINTFSKDKNQKHNDLLKRAARYGYYAIDTTTDLDINVMKTFTIRDITQINVNTTDKRQETTGMKCMQGWNKKLLGELIIKLQLTFPPDFIVNELDAKVIKLMDKSNINVHTTNAEDIKRTIYWLSKTQKQICFDLKTWFIQNDLFEVKIK
jgi:hypothetical protein